VTNSRYDELIERARAAFEPDPRVLAMWVEGSVARGTADAASDLDLHVALEDAAFDDFGSTPDVLARIGRPLGYLGVTLPGTRILPATLAGPVRIDLYLEQRSRAATAPRTPPRIMVFDRDEVERDLATAPPFTFDPKAQLETLMRSYWFGAMWPVRFTPREDWGGLLMNATLVVYEFIVPSLLIADGSPEFYRETYARPRFLAPERRAAIDALLAHALEAFAGIGAGGPNRDVLARFHERLLAAVWGAFREACSTAGIDYPSANEDEYRAYFARELGVTVPALG
jgi:predicted nucleotidyltransferase